MLKTFVYLNLCISKLFQLNPYTCILYLLQKKKNVFAVNNVLLHLARQLWGRNAVLLDLVVVTVFNVNTLYQHNCQKRSSLVCMFQVCLIHVHVMDTVTNHLQYQIDKQIMLTVLFVRKTASTMIQT